MNRFCHRAEQKEMNDMKVGSTPKWTYLSVLIGCCLMAGASMGLCVYSAGVFFEPIATALQVSLGQASLIGTLVLVSMACCTLLLPALMKVLSYRVLMYSGLVLAAGALVGSAVSFNTGWLYFFAILEGLGIAAFGIMPVTAIINNWFYSRTAWMTSLALAFSALTGAIFTPVLSFLVQALGWRMAIMLQAFFVVLFMLPSLLLPFEVSPGKQGLAPYGKKEEEKEVPFKKNEHPAASYFYVALFAILAASLIGLPQHFTSFAESTGRTAVFGAGLLSWCMIGNIIFKLAGGWCGEKLGALKTTFLLGVIVCVAALGMWICTFFSSNIALNILAFLYGAAYALSELSTPLLVQNQFGRPKFSSLYALMNFLSTLTMAASISVVGFFYDAVKGYGWIWFVTLLIALLLPFLSVVLMNDGHLPKSFSFHHLTGKDKEEGAWKTSAPQDVRPVPVMDAEVVAEPMQADVPDFVTGSSASKEGGQNPVDESLLSPRVMDNPTGEDLPKPSSPDDMVIELNGDDLDLPAWKMGESSWQSDEDEPQAEQKKASSRSATADRKPDFSSEQ